MKKRYQLFLLTALFGLSLLPMYAQKGKPLYTFPVGIQSYTYRHSFPKNLEATLDTIQSLGITELEGGNPKGTTPEEYRKMLSDRGITIPSTGANYDLIVSKPEEVIQKAKALGASYVMISWIPHKGAFGFEHAQKAVEDFNKAGKILKENGLILCYHDHGYEFAPYKDGTLFDYIAQNTDPAYVSFEMDVLWATHGGADPVKLLNKYGNRFKLMHLKDLKKGVKGDFTGGTPTENDVALGTGQINLPAVLKAAKKAGINHYFIEDESNDVKNQVPQSIAYLKSLRE